MADSITPMSVTTVKQNVFTETSFDNTVALWIQNTGNSAIYYAEKATEPTNELGGIIAPGEQWYFESGSTGIWLWSQVASTKAAIQEG